MNGHGAPGCITCAAILAAAVLGAAPARATNYFVRIGGDDAAPGNGWDTAFASIQRALSAVSNNADSDAWVFIGKTAATNYVPAAARFGFSLDLRLCGGFDPDTGVRDGLSEIGGVGNGLDLSAARGGSVTNTARFVLCDLKINTTGSGLFNNFVYYDAYATYALSNCVIGTLSPNVNPIYLVTPDYSPNPSLTLVGTTVSTPAGSPWSAVNLNSSPNGNHRYPSAVTLVDSVIQAQADGSVPGKYAALEQGWNSLIVRGSVVTNSGAGWAVLGGRGSYGGYDHTNAFVRSTIASSGGGINLNNNDFSPGGRGVLIADSTVIAGTLPGVFLSGWHGTPQDGGIPELVITNAVVVSTNEIGISALFSNGGAIDALLFDSELHGGDSAFRILGGGGNRGSDTLGAWRTGFAAGDVGGGRNSTNDVVSIRSYYFCGVTMDRCTVRNGRGGVNLSPGFGPTLSMVNSVVTDQDAFGVRLDGGVNSNERLFATNATFSFLGGPAIAWGDNGGAGGTLDGNLYYCAFAIGGSSTNFVNEDANQTLALNGYTNGICQYGTFYDATNGLPLTDRMAGTVRMPDGDAGISPGDGYHLMTDSRLANVYPLQPRDPAADIDGEERPFGPKADIGADESRQGSGGTVFLVGPGLAPP